MLSCPNIAYSEINSYENYSKYWLFWNMMLRELHQDLIFQKSALTKANPNIVFSEICTYENYSKNGIFDIKLRNLLQALTILKWALRRTSQNIDLFKIWSYGSFSKHRLFWNGHFRKVLRTSTFLKRALTRNTGKIDFRKYEVTIAPPNIEYSEIFTYENYSQHRLFLNKQFRELLKYRLFWNMKLR